MSLVRRLKTAVLKEQFKDNHLIKPSENAKTVGFQETPEDPNRTVWVERVSVCGLLKRMTMVCFGTSFPFGTGYRNDLTDLFYVTNSIFLKGHDNVVCLLLRCRMADETDPWGQDEWWHLGVHDS